MKIVTQERTGQCCYSQTLLTKLGLIVLVKLSTMLILMLEDMFMSLVLYKVTKIITRPSMEGGETEIIS